MLVWRLLLGTVLIAAVLALCWADAHAATPGVWLFPLALTITVLASGELLSLCHSRGIRPVAWVVYVGNIAIVSANWRVNLPAGPLSDPFDASALALALACVLAFLAEMVRFREPGRSLEPLAATLLALVYIGWLMSFLIQLRLLSGGSQGMAALLSMIAVVKMGDTGAYTVGRLIGRRKLAPRLSSGKTIEGLLGGLAFASFASWAVLQWLVPWLAPAPRSAAPELGWLAYGLVVGAAGVVGDLAESLLKRDAGRKDSSTWMPGFGGVLDIVDSLLIAAPVAYGFWALGWV
ncbi:MAG: phosphatidate cytidylyltransferase [Candidatus Levyibacteriota bacterium]